MRCMVRTFLVITVLVLVSVYFAVRVTNSPPSPEDREYENDEEIRRLLEGDVINSDIKPPVSISVAVVLVLCLVSVALLITGIIIVAITLDPSTHDDDSDIESDHSTMKPRSLYTVAEYDAVFADEEYEETLNHGYA